MFSEKYNVSLSGLASKAVSICVCLSALLFSPLAARAGQPTDLIRSAVDEVIRILNNEELAVPKNKEKRRSEIRKVIDERFDFREMAKRSMARHWRKISKEQQDEFVPLYADLLAATYLKRIERYQDEEVRYDEETLDGNYAKVKTRIVSPERTLEIPVEYRLFREGDHWKVYDVVIEGVSLVNNYRTQFNTIMHSDSFDILMARLKTKVEALEKED